MKSGEKAKLFFQTSLSAKLLTLQSNRSTEGLSLWITQNPNFAPKSVPPDREIRTITPEKLGKVYDAGENISGYVRIKAKAGYVGAITLRFSEEIKDGELDFGSSG